MLTNAPSPPRSDEKPSLEPARPDAKAALRLTIHRFPSASTGSWYWLRGWQPKTSRTPTAAPTRSVFARSQLRRGRRSSRTLVLWMLVWYAAFLLFPIFRGHRWQRIAQAIEARKWPELRQLLADQPDRPLVMMLGSSRGCHAFRAGNLNGMPDSDGRPLSVFNFAVHATGPITELFFLRDMLAEGIRPRFLLIEFLPPLLCEAQRGALTEEGMTGFESVSVRRVLQWMPYLRRREKRAHLWLCGRLNPYYAFRRQIQLEVKCLLAGLPFPDYDPIDEWGWHIASPLPLTAEERAIRVEVARGGYSPGLGNFHLGKIPEQALRETLDVCRREKIPAALVVMPESSEFRSWYSENAKKTIRNLLNDLCQTYKVPLIDANTWVEDKDFADGHHVQMRGANLFTSRMADELTHLLEESKDVKSDTTRPARRVVPDLRREPH